MKKILFLVACLSLVVGAVAYLAEVEAPELGAAAIAHARAATGLSLSAATSRFGLRRGLTLEGVEASSSFPGGRYRVSLRAIRLRHRLSALWSGRLEMSEAVLVEPRIEVNLGLGADEPPASIPERTAFPRQAPASETGDTDQSSAMPLQLAVDLTTIELLDGVLVLRDQRREGNRLSLSGLHVRFDDLGYDSNALTVLHGLRGHDAFGIGSLKLETSELRDIAGELAVEGGRFTMDPLELTTPLGRFEGRVSLDFNVIPFRYRMSLTSAAANLPGVGSGGALRISADGFGTDSRNLSGEGRLDLTEGVLPPSPLKVAIENALGLDLSKRGGATVSFRLEKDRIQLEPSRVVAGDANLDFEGFVELEGPIDLTVTNEDGKSVQLTGTLDHPEALRN